MTIFYVHSESWETGEKKIFTYDNEFSSISEVGGTKVDLTKFDSYKANLYRRMKQFSEKHPINKSNSPVKFKIQLGLKCNYSCDYCSQALHTNDSVDFTPKQIDDFLLKFEKLDLSKIKQVEFWGGEPFVYWKSLKPLAEKIRKILPDVSFLTITNGSLITDEIIEWLDKMNFSIAISHDGPGQHIRGPNPFDDFHKKEMILKLFNRLHPKGKISFNAVLTVSNNSRQKIHDYFKHITGCDDVAFGEGAFIEAHNDGGVELSLYDYQDMIKFRRNSLSEMYNLDRNRVSVVNNKITNFISSVVNERSWYTLGQKCGMDSTDNIAVDINGSVLSCQNVSSNLIAENGNSHNIGNIENLSEVKLNTGKHWSFRESCSKCPVLQLCGGSCFILQNEHWARTCDNSYNDNIVFFMYAFELMTGYLPYYIEHKDLPDWRKDILGMDKPELTRKRKIIPIKELV